MALKPTDSKKNEKTDSDQSSGPSAEDEILMREIDEAVRKDDAEQFFKKYGLPVGGLLAVFLAGLGFYLLYWVPSQEGALEKQSETLVQAMDASGKGQPDDLKKADEMAGSLAGSDTPGARTSARFVQAGVALEQGNEGAAVELFKQIADDPDAPPALRDLARIREVSTNFDDRKPADIIARLSDLAKPGNPFFGSAGELVAIAHQEAGDNQKAGALWSQIANDESVPETIRARARQMAGLLGVDAIKDVEQLLEDEGVDVSGGNDAAAVMPPAASE